VSWALLATSHLTTVAGVGVSEVEVEGVSEVVTTSDNLE